MSIFDLPPSPPSTSSRRKLSHSSNKVAFMGTPDSPASFPGSSGTGNRKRVEFSTWTNNEHTNGVSQSSPTVSVVKALPPSSECQSALKSILKTTSVGETAVVDNEATRHEDLSVSEMMESIMQQLSCDERTISVDAYQTLCRVIKQYDDIPEEAILKTKIPSILRYIKRDILRPILEIADTNLITQAIKVLVIFVWSPEYSTFLTDEFRSFVLDRSILVISEHTAPKSIIMHYLHLLATQDFRSSLITFNNRVTRLLEALKSLSDHIKGNGIISERLLVYRKLLTQAKATMKGKAHLWIEELLTGMTHHMKEIRARALDLGLESCLAFPASFSISSSVRSVLEKELENGMTLGTAMSRKLEKMIVGKEDMIHVPQIWAITLLLSNNSENRVDDWRDLKDWLKVIQRCFNCSESVVRQQSNVAWNRFVSVVRPHEASDSLLSMLAKPITAQLEKQATENSIKSTRATAVSSYCNLLYYAFRPAATHKQYTRVWNEYIVKVMRSSFFEKNSANSDISCRVLIALLWNSSKGTKVWNEGRALQDSRPMEPEELPTIDCKWVRMRCPAIVDMFCLLLKYSSWGASGQSDKAHIAVAWTHFLRALKEASSKEIKPSAEAKNATFAVLDFLCKRWEGAVQSNRNDLEQSMAQIRQMMRTAIFELGYVSIMMTLEAGTLAHVKPLFSELFDSMVSDICTNPEAGESQSSVPGHRVPSQALVSSYEKCLELFNAFVIGQLERLATTPCSEKTHEISEIMSRLLTNTPQELLTPTLLRLREPLIRTLTQLAGNDLDSLGQNVVSVLDKVPTIHIRELDDVFGSVFECITGDCKQEAYIVWNAQFGQNDVLVVGPKLQQILTQSHNLTPPKNSCASRQDSGNVTNEIEDAQQDEETANKLVAGVDQFGVPSPILGSQGRIDWAAKVATEEEVCNDHEDNTGSSPMRSNPRQRPRHDDSQMHFVPIVSSSPPNDEPESQFLTTHQKEVRDRQRSEPAVVFPDLRSSPRPHSRSQSYGDCEFARKAAILDECPSTPVLPTHHDQTEMEIMESPTPRARHFTARILDLEVPSSPPSMPDNPEDRINALANLSSPPQVAVDDAQIAIQIGLPPLDPVEEASVGSIATRLPVRDTQPLPENHFSSQNMLIIEPAPEKDINNTTDSVQIAYGDHEGFSAHGLENNPTIADDFRPRTPVEEVKVSSDEIDMLSASQLSQDLDRHVSRKVPSSPLSFRQPESRLDHAGGEELTQNERKSYNVRKRKAHNYAGPVKRRRQKISSQLTSSSLDDRSSSSQLGSQQVLQDCIEVFTSSPAQAGTESNTQTSIEEAGSQPTGTTKRRRGRPRKYPRRRASKERQPSAGNLDLVPILYPAQFKTESDIDNDRVDSNMQRLEQQDDSELIRNDERLNAQIAEATEIERSNADGQDITACDARHVSIVEDVSALQQDLVNEDGLMPATILTSLQSALDQLKSSTSGDKIDLRAIDDLCFQIRFQAQVLAQRPV